MADPRAARSFDGDIVTHSYELLMKHANLSLKNHSAYSGLIEKPSHMNICEWLLLKAEEIYGLLETFLPMISNRCCESCSEMKGAGPVRYYYRSRSIGGLGNPDPQMAGVSVAPLPAMVFIEQTMQSYHFALTCVLPKLAEKATRDEKKDENGNVIGYEERTGLIPFLRELYHHLKGVVRIYVHIYYHHLEHLLAAPKSHDDESCVAGLHFGFKVLYFTCRWFHLVNMREFAPLSSFCDYLWVKFVKTNDFRNAPLTHQQMVADYTAIPVSKAFALKTKRADFVLENMRKSLGEGYLNELGIVAAQNNVALAYATAHACHKAEGELAANQLAKAEHYKLKAQLFADSAAQLEAQGIRGPNTQQADAAHYAEVYKDRSMEVHGKQLRQQIVQNPSLLAKAIVDNREKFAREHQIGDTNRADADNEQAAIFYQLRKQFRGALSTYSKTVNYQNFFAFQEQYKQQQAQQQQNNGQR